MGAIAIFVPPSPSIDSAFCCVCAFCRPQFNHRDGILYNVAALVQSIFSRSFASTPSKLSARACWVFGQVEVAKGNCADQRMFSVPINFRTRKLALSYQPTK